MATVTAPGGSTVVVGKQSDYNTVVGPGTVKAGNGNDTVVVEGHGKVNGGSGQGQCSGLGQRHSQCRQWQRHHCRPFMAMPVSKAV